MDNGKDTWVKKRHARTFAFLRLAMTPFFKLRYNYVPERAPGIKPPCLIVFNHQASMDPFFVSDSFGFPVYFFASDDIFNLKVSPLIRYLVAPIPKSKSVSDLNAVRTALKIFREGGAVGVAPEGNRTLSGRLWETDDSIAKLAKLSKVPLVIYNLCGGYGTDPRWGGKIRRGTKYVGRVKRVISPDEYKNMSVAELFATIKTELDVDDAASGERYKSRRRAEYIERALYMCPNCGAAGSIYSKGVRFGCRNCGVRAGYTEDLKISPPVCGFDRIYPWYEWQKKEIVRSVAEGGGVSDGGILFRESVKFRRKVKLGGDKVEMNGQTLTVSGKGVGHVYPLDEIDAVTAVGKKKFNFYHKGKILQVKGNRRFCSVKYVHIFNGLRALAAQKKSEEDKE